MSAALRSGGVAAIRGSVHNLELIGPVRAANFGDPPTVEPPQSVREEINELIHSLDGRSENDDGRDDGELCR